ncbi:MAG TPA: hypothetical protein VII23_24830 [Terriglobales bacterium]
MRGQYRGGEGDDDHPEHQCEVDDQQHVIALLDVGEQAMMVDPHDADECKADEKRQVGRPLAQQLRGEISSVGTRHLDLQNQQSDGDGEYAV